MADSKRLLTLRSATRVCTHGVYDADDGFHRVRMPAAKTTGRWWYVTEDSTGEALLYLLDFNSQDADGFETLVMEELPRGFLTLDFPGVIVGVTEPWQFSKAREIMVKGERVDVGAGGFIYLWEEHKEGGEVIKWGVGQDVEGWCQISYTAHGGLVVGAHELPRWFAGDPILEEEL